MNQNHKSAMRVRGRPRKQNDLFTDLAIVRLHAHYRRWMGRDECISRIAIRLGTYQTNIKQVLSQWQPENAAAVFHVKKKGKAWAISLGPRPKFGERGKQRSPRVIFKYSKKFPLTY